MTIHQAFVTGMITGTFMHSDVLRCRVEVQRDEAGDYLPEVRLTMPGGVKLQIAVTVLESGKE